MGSRQAGKQRSQKKDDGFDGYEKNEVKESNIWEDRMGQGEAGRLWRSSECKSLNMGWF